MTELNTRELTKPYLPEAYRTDTRIFQNIFRFFCAKPVSFKYYSEARSNFNKATNVFLLSYKSIVALTGLSANKSGWYVTETFCVSYQVLFLA